MAADAGDRVDGDGWALARESAADALTLRLTGRLDSRTVGAVWGPALAAAAGAPVRLVVDAAAVGYCDGAGIALLIELRRRQDARGADFALVGASDQVARLFDRYGRLPAERPPAPPVRRDLARRTGDATLASADGLVRLIGFVGDVTLALGAVIARPALLRWRDTVRLGEAIGVTAVPLVILLGVVLGLIMAFQSAVQLTYYGADLLVANVVGLSMVRELGPMMTAVILTGRSGSAFAAELGAMKVNEEINALTTMGVDPVRFLVIPRLVAMVVMAPILTVIMDLGGLVGGGVVMVGLGFPPVIYIDQVVGVVSVSDYLGGLLKSVVFGAIVAGVGCRSGLATAGGPRGVGEATTRSMVWGIVLIIVADGLFAVTFYALGW